MLNGRAIVNTVPKSFLEVYNAQKGIKEYRYVSEMRNALLEYWETERVEQIVIDLTADSEKKEESPKNEEKQPEDEKTKLHVQDASTSIITRSQREMAATSVVQSPTHPTHYPDSPQRTATNIPPPETKKSSLGEQFVEFFYPKLYEQDIQPLVDLFPSNAVAYLFLFAANGDHVVAEQKATGIPQIRELLPLLGRFHFRVHTQTENIDDFGVLRLVAKGTITHNQLPVGIFTHFFTFVQLANGNYVVRESSFHVKTHADYQPLANVLPYRQPTSRLTN